MTLSVIIGHQANLVINVMQDGKPLAITGSLTARVFSTDGKHQYVDDKALFEDDTGADWPMGVVPVYLTDEEAGSIPPGDALLVLSGDFGIKRFRIVAEQLFAVTRSSLFIKDIVVDEIRQDRLMAAAAGVLQDISISDQYIWEKVRAAESEMSHTLRVPLVPTHFFPLQPTQSQIDALDGMDWAVDPPYDYSPDMFQYENWGFFVTRQRPLILVDHIRFSYPSQESGFVTIPQDWIRYDAKYGHIRLVPSSPAIFMQMNSYIMTALTGGRGIPFMIQIEYEAGLTDVPKNYPELLDAIKKKAILKIVGDAYLPQSGSISADGLTETVSVDMSKYHDSVDHIINGPPGSNGGLMTKIHGIRMLAM